MKKKDFSEILNNSNSLTIGQIIKLVLKIKYRVLIGFIIAFLAITGSAYVAGQAIVKQEAAVMLRSPFSMRITDINGNIHDFEKLTLIEDPTLLSTNADKITMSLKQIKSDFDIIQVGLIIAKASKENVPFIWEWLFSSISPKSAHARTEKIFSWNGHNGDYSFKEQHQNEHTIYRYYLDDCVLEYKINKNRRSIPASFRWVKKTH